MALQLHHFLRVFPYFETAVVELTIMGQSN